MADRLSNISADFRNALIGRNLVLAESVQEFYGSYTSQLGTFVNIGSINPSVVDTPSINDTGFHYRNLITSSNRYQTDEFQTVNIENVINQESIGEYSAPENLSDSPLSSPDSTFLGGLSPIEFNTSRNIYVDNSQQIEVSFNSSFPISQNLGSYVDENNNLRIGTSSTQAIDVLGSIIEGQGIGINQNGGLEPGFDLRSSLAGRALTGFGVIDDTPIGVIGARELGRSLLNNAAFGLQQETIGNINLSPFNLLKGGDIIVPNYDITIPASTGGRILDFGARVLGFELPLSVIKDEASIFSSDSPNTGFLERNNALLKNTGKGQVISLFSNIKGGGKIPGNKFRPAYEDSRVNDGIIPDLYYSSNTETKQEVNVGNTTKDFDSIPKNYGWFVDDERQQIQDAAASFFGSEAIDISSLNTFKNPNSLLSKTKKIFNTGKLSKLMSGSLSEPSVPGEINSSISEGEISKGNLQRGPSGEFCRVWNLNKRYDNVSALQKNSGLNINAGLRENIGESVLDDNGFVRIAPKKNDTDMKRFMFSIENLAWNGYLLPPCEQGPGDLTTGAKGRIMWFPPYDISFNETTSVNWDSTNFIGRGEPVYTYNNTERTGTLAFKVVVDHPSYLNSLKSDIKDELITQIFYGCDEISETIKDKLTPAELEAIKVAKAQETTVVSDNKYEEFEFEVYFPNNLSKLNLDYESKGDLSSPVEGIGDYEDDLNVGQFDKADFGLNKKFISEVSGGSNSQISKILLEECLDCRIEIFGNASNHGTTSGNIELANNRAISLKNLLTNDLGIEKDRITFEGFGDDNSNFDPDKTDISSIEAKRDRNVFIKIKSNPEQKEELTNNGNTKKPKTNSNNVITDDIAARFINECAYFEKLKENDSFAYDKIRRKLNFFHPGFHSTTPEGLNSRLTFLQQCTRQGPTGDGTTRPNNLAFGTAPVCILRIGDFYHTKIIISDLSIDYDPLVWDLNPEGIGVQPMIASINISFKFIGGSSLAGPINKLQNAVSFNFFANTEVYDVRADKIIDGEIKNGVDLGKINEEKFTFNEGTSSESNNNNSEGKNAIERDDEKTNEQPSKNNETNINNPGISLNGFNTITYDTNKLNITFRVKGLDTASQEELNEFNKKINKVVISDSNLTTYLTTSGLNITSEDLLNGKVAFDDTNSLQEGIRYNASLFRDGNKISTKQFKI